MVGVRWRDYRGPGRQRDDGWTGQGLGRKGAQMTQLRHPHDAVLSNMDITLVFAECKSSGPFEVVTVVKSRATRKRP